MKTKNKSRSLESAKLTKNQLLYLTTMQKDSNGTRLTIGELSLDQLRVAYFYMARGEEASTRLLHRIYRLTEECCF